MTSFEKFLEEMRKIDGNLITEEMKNELIEIFNTAVEIRAKELKNTLKEEMTNEAVELKEEMKNEAVELRDELVTEANDFKDKLVNTLDKFLSDSVDIFFEKYESNIEDDIKLVFYENFFNHVKEGFEKNNFQLDESDVNIMKSLKKKLEEKDEIINSKITEIYNLNEQVLMEKVKAILNEKTKGMSDMERDKLYNLLEEVDFETIEDAVKKIDIFIEKFNDVEVDKDITDFNKDKVFVNESKSDSNIVQKWANLI